MESRIAQSLRLPHQPVAVLLSDEAPEDSFRFRPGKWGCVMMAFASVAGGRTAAFDRDSYGCWGGGVGLGFGNAYEKFPGGMDGIARFLSTGSGPCSEGRRGDGADQVAASRSTDNRFAEGEHYLASPEVARRFVETLPMRDVPSRYVVFKPLDRVDATVERPTTVVFTVDADRLSALVVLANFGTQGDNVTIPFAAGCQAIGILPWREAEANPPRAVVGLIDISARKYVRRTLGKDSLTFAAPWSLFLQMESNVDHSFLSREIWKELLG